MSRTPLRAPIRGPEVSRVAWSASLGVQLWDADEPRRRQARSDARWGVAALVTMLLAGLHSAGACAVWGVVALLGTLYQQALRPAATDMVAFGRGLQDFEEQLQQRGWPVTTRADLRVLADHAVGYAARRMVEPEEQSATADVQVTAR